MENSIRGISTLYDLLEYAARKFTSSEIQLKNCLPNWINKTGSPKLKTVLQKYLELVQAHTKQMEDFFEEENIRSYSLGNRVMQAYIDEAQEALSQCNDITIRDACLLANIQSINHYKISTYGTAASFANTLGMENHAAVFHAAEVNEKQIDDRLSQLAEHEINSKARAHHLTE